VIKIEQPGEARGDVTGSRRDGFDFQNLHRNKRSLTLNLKTEEGKAIFFKLAEKADVIVENFRSEVKYRLGVDYESVKKVNPRIVYGSISGFGQSGPYAKRPGVDQIAQGMGGLMSITGLPGQGPVRVGIPIDDLCAGLLLAQAMMMALIERETSGVGQWVHTSLLEAQIFMLDFQASRWLMAGEVAKQAGNDHPTGIPTGVFPTSDGQINIAASGDHMFRRFCEAADAMELLDDPDYATGAQRSKNRKALNERIGEITKKRPQVQHLEMARPIDHPKLGPIKAVGQAINMTRTPEPEKLRPTPELGQHTDEILHELGYNDAAIAQLRAREVV
jgi:crotonobetainyl-CoA:carnitine CoA-transferase CaiB-like acyl-CoA transferase